MSDRCDKVTTQPARNIASCRRRILVLGLALLAPGTQGCEAPGPSGQAGGAPTPGQVADMHTEPNISNVAVFYDPYSAWIWTEDRSRVCGIKVGPVYLIGPGGKGAFGDGVIRPRLYRLDRGTDGRVKPVLIKEWSFTVEEALPLRIKREKALGWGYGLPLVWGDQDLLADGVREVRMVVAFERSDERTINSSKKDLRVPRGAY